MTAASSLRKEKIKKKYVKGRADFICYSALKNALSSTSTNVSAGQWKRVFIRERLTDKVYYIGLRNAGGRWRQWLATGRNNTACVSNGRWKHTRTRPPQPHTHIPFLYMKKSRTSSPLHFTRRHKHRWQQQTDDVKWFFFFSLTMKTAFSGEKVINLGRNGSTCIISYDGVQSQRAPNTTKHSILPLIGHVNLWT